MLKADLIKIIKNNSGVSRREVEKFLNAFVSTIKENIQNENKISLVGFGSFELGNRRATIRYDAYRKQRINIPAKKYLKFTASQVITANLNRL